MADFGPPALAPLWLLAGVPLMAFVALSIGFVAGIRTLWRASGVTRGLSTGGRAMALALALPVFPLIPIACREARFTRDLGEVNTVLAWLSVLLFIGGCVWLARGGRPDPTCAGENSAGRLAGGKLSTWLARLFWTVLWIEVLAALPLIMGINLNRIPQYPLTDAVLLLLSVALLGAAIAAVAMTRHPGAYGTGLALTVALPLLYGNFYPLDRARPSDEALRAGHGYFRRTADRALATAIVAGEGAKAVSLIPAVNPNTVGWRDMTFMRLALQRGHEDVDPDVVGALLKAGADPDGDNSLLLLFIAAVDPDAGVAITSKNQRLLTALFDAKVDLNRVGWSGQPLFFRMLSRPASLAEMLDHGANTEAEDSDGNTALMSAVWNRNWRSIDVLLAHGARLDHVNRRGTSLRDMTLIASTWDRDPSPQLATFLARLPLAPALPQAPVPQAPAPRPSLPSPTD